VSGSSAFSFANGPGYAVIGNPPIIFGVLLGKSGASLQYSLFQRVYATMVEDGGMTVRLGHSEKTYGVGRLHHVGG
jgi:hypothetical protein